jgi:adenosylcobinamide-GDP ribazoletransferase
MTDETPRTFADWQGDALRAVAFLTRFPLAPRPAEPGALARAAWAFPLTGILIGAFGGVVFALADRLDLPILATALLAVLATAVATGGLHEDGLADTVDGLGGGADKAQALAIMRDSRTGAFGVLALIFSVGLRAAALAALADTRVAIAALIAAHALSRGLLPAVMRVLDPARPDGLAANAGKPGVHTVAIAAAIGVVTAAAALGLPQALIASALAVLAVAAVALLARQRLGGYTGDILGAAQQAAEIVMLLAVAA